MKAVQGFLQTQPLWTKKQFELQQFRFPELVIEQLLPFDIPVNLRLGHQVEHIFLNLLQQHPQYKVLKHSIQIKKGNATKGELDFLIQFQERVIHLELSYKFYLIDPKITQPIYRLVGPNRGDMFFTKLDKTKDRQLPLLYSDLCKPILETMNLKASEIYQEVCFMGQLFVPVSQAIPSIRPLNKNCIVGYWMTMSEFKKKQYAGSEYYIPFKREWIHPPHKEALWLSHFEALMDVNIKHINKNAPMLWRKLPDGTIDVFFVVWW